MYGNPKRKLWISQPTPNRTVTWFCNGRFALTIVFRHSKSLCFTECVWSLASKEERQCSSFLTAFFNMQILLLFWFFLKKHNWKIPSFYRASSLFTEFPYKLCRSILNGLCFSDSNVLQKTQKNWLHTISPTPCPQSVFSCLCAESSLLIYK